MTTKVGAQENFAEALKSLVELDFDAIEAYQAAINRIEALNSRSQLTLFKQDHERHTRELSAVLKEHKEEAPTGPSAKQWLTKGKVILANLVGDNAILKAMITNEMDTNTAYERLNNHAQKWADADEPLKRGLEDERRHKAWLEAEVSKK